MEIDLDYFAMLQWKCFQKVLARNIKVGKPKIVIHLQHMHIQSFEFLSFMGPKLKQFVLHNFLANWQDG